MQVVRQCRALTFTFACLFLFTSTSLPANRKSRAFSDQLEPANQSRARAFTNFAWAIRLELDDDSASAEAEKYYLAALYAMPESSFILGHLVGPWLEHGEYEIMVRELSPIARDNPQAIHLQMTLSSVLQRLNRRSEAVELLDRAFHAGKPGSPILFREFAALLWRDKRFSELEHLLYRARRSPEFRGSFILEYAQASFYAAIAEDWAGQGLSERQARRRQRRALSHARKAVEIIDNTARFKDLERLFHILSEAKSWAKASALLDRGHTLFPRQTREIEYLEITLLLQQQRRPEALKKLTAIASQAPLEIEAQNRIGQLYLEMEEYEKARDYLKVVFLQSPTGLSIRYMLAYAKNQLGQHQAAYDLLQEVETGFPALRLLQSYAAKEIQDYERAFELSELAAAKAEKSSNEYFNQPDFALYQAMLLERLGKVEPMFELVEKTYAESPDCPFVNNFLGYMLADHNRDLDRAEKLIAIAVEAEPESVAIRDSLAWVYYRQGRFAEAIREINLTLSMSRQRGKTNHVIFSHAGDIYAANHYPRLAIYYWRLALLFDHADTTGLTARIERVIGTISSSSQNQP